MFFSSKGFHTPVASVAKYTTPTRATDTSKYTANQSLHTTLDMIAYLFVPQRDASYHYPLPASQNKMKEEIVEIEIYNREEGVLSTISVERISENRFRTIANEIVDCRLTYKTEFETRLNSDKQHEISLVDKNSEFITRRFNLTSQFKESEYRLLGDEIMKEGGFWQVDFGSIATVNLPKESKLNLDEVFKIFNFSPNEIID